MSNNPIGTAAVQGRRGDDGLLWVDIIEEDETGDMVLMSMLARDALVFALNVLEVSNNMIEEDRWLQAIKEMGPEVNAYIDELEARVGDLRADDEPPWLGG